MKRIIICITALAAAIALAGCQKQEGPVELASTYVFELNATAGDPVTKAYYEDNMTFTWTEGDQISVLFHNGSDNQFFTLDATTINGASAVFSGAITTGYELGSSDTGDMWALYPAGAHSYVGGDSTPITFNVPAVTDLTGKALSCNLPMAAISDDGTSFTFKPASGAFKFSFTGIKCSKVKFVVEQQVKQRQLSGDFPMKKGGYVGYWQPKWADLGSGPGKIAFIEDVVKGRAEFFIPFAPWDNYFQPIITLTDADTDDLLYTATAKAPFGGDMGSLLNRMVVVPDIAITEVKPWSFTSAYGIDWDSVTASAAGDGEYDAISLIKGTADATNLYLYMEVKKSALFDDPSVKYGNHFYLYFGDGTGEKSFWAWEQVFSTKLEAWLIYDNSPKFTHWTGGITKPAAVEHDGKYYYEIAITRSTFSFLAGSSAVVACYVDGQSCKIVDESEVWGGSSDAIGYGPARWQPALTVTLP